MIGTEEDDDAWIRATGGAARRDNRLSGTYAEDGRMDAESSRKDGAGGWPWTRKEQ